MQIETREQLNHEISKVMEDIDFLEQEREQEQKEGTFLQCTNVL